MKLDRRGFLRLGCAAIALSATSEAAAFTLHPTPAPRVECPHRFCRHHRPDPSNTTGTGLCGLSIHAPALTELP